MYVLDVIYVLRKRVKIVGKSHSAEKKSKLKTPKLVCLRGSSTFVGP